MKSYKLLLLLGWFFLLLSISNTQSLDPWGDYCGDDYCNETYYEVYYDYTDEHWDWISGFGFGYGYAWCGYNCKANLTFNGTSVSIKTHGRGGGSCFGSCRFYVDGEYIMYADWSNEPPCGGILDVIDGLPYEEHYLYISCIADTAIDGAYVDKQENITSCPQDCWECGDNICTSPYETQVSCCQDCGALTFHTCVDNENKLTITYMILPFLIAVGIVTWLAKSVLGSPDSIEKWIAIILTICVAIVLLTVLIAVS